MGRSASTRVPLKGTRSLRKVHRLYPVLLVTNELTSRPLSVTDIDCTVWPSRIGPVWPGDKGSWMKIKDLEPELANRTTLPGRWAMMVHSCPSQSGSHP